MSKTYAETRAMQGELSRLQALQEQITQVIDTIRTQDQKVLSADIDLELSVKEIYGDQAGTVLADLNRRTTMDARGEVIRTLSTDPAKLGILDAKWRPLIPRPGLRSELLKAGRTATSAFIEANSTRVDNSITLAKVAEQQGLPQTSTSDAVQRALSTRQASTAESIRQVQTQLRSVSITKLTREIRATFGTLSHAERVAFIGANPKLKSLLKVGKDLSKMANGPDPSRGR